MICFKRLPCLLPVIVFACLLALSPFPVYADGGAPNLAYVAGTTPGISVIDIQQQKVTGTFPIAGDPRALFLSLDGRFLYIAQPAQGRVTMLAAKTGQTLCHANLAGQPSLLAYDPGANILYAAGNGSSTVSVLNPTNCAITRTLSVIGSVYGLAVAIVGSGALGGNGNQLWVADTSGLTIFTTAGKQQETVPIAAGPQSLCLPPGTMVYVTTRQGEIVAVDISTYHVTPLFSGGTFGSMDYDINTGDVYVPDQQHNQLDVLSPLTSGNTPPHEPERIYKLTAVPQSIAITGDGQLGFVALNGGEVVMLDIPGHQIVGSIHVGGNPQFIITGLYPPLVGTTPQQASTWGTTITVLAYLLVLVLIVVPILLFMRVRRADIAGKGRKRT